LSLDKFKGPPSVPPKGEEENLSLTLPKGEEKNPNGGGKSKKVKG